MADGQYLNHFFNKRQDPWCAWFTSENSFAMFMGVNVCWTRGCETFTAHGATWTAWGRGAGFGLILLPGLWVQKMLHPWCCSGLALQVDTGDWGMTPKLHQKTAQGSRLHHQLFPSQGLRIPPRLGPAANINDSSQKAGCGGSKPSTICFSVVQESAAWEPVCLLLQVCSTWVSLEQPFPGCAGLSASLTHQFSTCGDDVFLQLCFGTWGEPYYLCVQHKDKLAASWAPRLSSQDHGGPGFVAISLSLYKFFKKAIFFLVVWFLFGFCVVVGVFWLVVRFFGSCFLLVFPNLGQRY